MCSWPDIPSALSEGSVCADDIVLKLSAEPLDGVNGGRPIDAKAWVRLYVAIADEACWSLRSGAKIFACGA